MVDRDDVCARCRQLGDERPLLGVGVGRHVDDDGRVGPRGLDGANDLPLEGGRPLVKLGRREVARPRVKDLNHLCARVDLVDCVLRDPVAEQLEHVRHELGVGLSELPHRREARLSARGTLDKVRAQREREADEPKHRRVGTGQRRAQPLEHVADKADLRLGLEGDGGHLGEGFARADRVDRDPSALGDRKVDAHRRQRREDV
mmetsp:Transcript_42223/g.137014  ORF Transcript_42223/g.137014 Transcript_42223/m.137014 type:complete len:203 (-) Transcript_42223:348-956(-)